jgi:hypothetical protein
MDLFGLCAVDDAQRQAPGHGRFGVPVGVQKRQAAQQRELPIDPHAPSARFAIRHALQMFAQQFARGREDLLRRIEAHAAHQMDMQSRHDPSPCDVVRYRPTERITARFLKSIVI